MTQDLQGNLSKFTLSPSDPKLSILPPLQRLRINVDVLIYVVGIGGFFTSLMLFLSTHLTVLPVVRLILQKSQIHSVKETL